MEAELQPLTRLGQPRVIEPVARAGLPFLAGVKMLQAVNERLAPRSDMATLAVAATAQDVPASSRFSGLAGHRLGEGGVLPENGGGVQKVSGMTDVPTEGIVESRLA